MGNNASRANIVEICQAGYCLEWINGDIFGDCLELAEVVGGELIQGYFGCAVGHTNLNVFKPIVFLLRCSSRQPKTDSL